MVPIIAYHGAWTVLFTMVALFISGFSCTWLAMSAKRPQTTFVASTTNRQQMIGKLLLLRAQAQSNNQPGLATIYDNQITDLKETMQ